MNFKHRLFRFFAFTAVILLCIGLFGEIAFSQEGREDTDSKGASQSFALEFREDDGAYVSKKYRFSVVPPKSFKPMPEDEVKALVLESRKGLDLPEEIKQQALNTAVVQTIFQPEGPDASMKSLVVLPGRPPFKTLEEFEQKMTPDEGDFVSLSRETLTINYRPCFLLDREFDRQGHRFRQLCAYFQDFLPQGYMLLYSAVSVGFDEHRDAFIESLKTFKIIPPEVPGGAKEAKYSDKMGMKGKGTPAWRSPEVIASLIFVAAFVIWFLVRRLSAGAEKESDSPSQKEENPSTTPGDESSKEDL